MLKRNEEVVAKAVMFGRCAGIVVYSLEVVEIRIGIVDVCCGAMLH